MLGIRNDFSRDVAARHRHRRAEPTRARQRTRSGDARRARSRIRRACRGPRRPARRAARQRQTFLRRSRSRRSHPRRGRHARRPDPVRCAGGDRPPAQAHHRGGAWRRHRRRRRNRGLLRCRGGYRCRILLDPGGPGRNGAGAVGTDFHPRHGPSQLSPLWPLGGAHGRRRSAARRPGASALHAANARRGNGGDRRRAVTWSAGRNPRAQIGLRRDSRRRHGQPDRRPSRRDANSRGRRKPSRELRAFAKNASRAGIRGRNGCCGAAEGADGCPIWAGDEASAAMAATAGADRTPDRSGRDCLPWR